MKNKHFVKFKIYIFFSFFISISICFEPQYFYCNNRIYCDSELTYSQINSICDLINEEDRFVILLTNNITYLNEEQYSKTSENFFENQCKYNSIKCEYNFAISIYITGGKVLISAGKTAIKKVDENQRMNIINSMIDLLQRGKYYQAISLAITLLQNSFPLDPNNQNIKNSNNITTTNVTSQNVTSNQTIVTPPTTTTTVNINYYSIFFIILLICFVVLLILYILKKREEGNRIESCLQIHNHLYGLELLIKEIRKSSPPIISIHKCVICMKDIIYKDHDHSFQTNENDNFNSPDNNFTNNSFDISPNNSLVTNQNNSKDYIDNLNIRFACQHIYHITCLNSCKINFCLMCANNDTSMDITNNARVQIENKHNKQVIHEGHIKNFIQNFNYIYKKGELSDYAQKYPLEFETFNTTLLLGLSRAWGIAFMIPRNFHEQMRINNQNYYGNSNNNNYNNYEEEEQELINGFYKHNNINNENQSDGVTAHFGNSTNQESNVGTFGINENNKFMDGEF